MQARIVPAGNGVRWLLEGMRIFRAAPIGWMVLVLVYFLAMILSLVIPVVGMVLWLLVTPAISLGFMAAGRAASTSGEVAVPMLLEGFRLNPRAQLALGGIYLALVLSVISLTVFMAGQRPAVDTEHLERSVNALGLFAALYSPVMMMFWYAPQLVSWHGAGAAKSLFYSFFAVLLNWRAFLAYGAVVAVFSLGAAGLAATLAGLVLPDSARSPQHLSALSVALAIAIYPILLGSFYASYRDVFAPPEPPPQPTAAA